MRLSTAIRRVHTTVQSVLQPTGCGEYVRRQRVSLIVNCLCPTAGLVVDVGGGTGTLRSALRLDLQSRYTVLDIDGGPHGRRIIADIVRIPLPNSVVDLVCLSDVLEHVVDDVAALGEAVRVLRIGGHLVVHVPSLRSKPLGIVRRAADEAEEADHQQFPHVRDGYDLLGLASMLARVPSAEVVQVAPSFTALQSIMSDLDSYLWWRRLTVMRALPWTAIRIASLGSRVPPARSSSGFVGVLRRTQ